ncbi:MAG TPA: class I SAM-dependent methyltransferase [Trebonia sp.]|nr:class I SAM-dependent methyltransferase [Trebonia sp.]
MNDNHLQMLASPRWAEVLRTHVLPWLESVGELGDDVLEIGPGPGLTTDLLLTMTTRITAVEVDAGLAAQLARRLAGSNVEVINTSAERTGLAADRFSAAACFAVLHHTETAAVQDRVFAELLRVLRPGGILVGSEGYDNERTRQAHAGDQFVPVDPDGLPRRLSAIGFTEIAVEHGEFDFRFHARKRLLDNCCTVIS